MDDNKLRFGVGVLVISAIGIGIILIFLFGAFPSVLKRDYSLSVVFPSAEGIAVNTAVVRDGVRIGRVSSIDLQDTGGVLISLSMDSAQRLTHEYVPRISAGKLVTGDSKLEFVKATPRMLTQIFGDDTEIIPKPYIPDEFLDYGTKTESLFEMQNDLQDTFNAIQSAGESIAIAGESVNQLAIQVRELAGGTDSKVADVAADASAAIEEFRGAMLDIRAIVGNPEFKQNLEQSMARVPGLLDDTQKALDAAQTTFESFERAGNQFEKVGLAAEETVQTAQGAVLSAQSTFENLEGFTEPLSERGGEMVEQLMKTLSSFDTAMTQVGIFGESLNASDGSLKRFLEDDEIYYRIRRTIQNIELASAKVRPILDDVRVFSDKIARDPRQLGVRGAISRRPSGAGLK
jgi:phospholipid/cholesterol/gamma-HCH transport system substrate-binding protein